MDGALFAINMLVNTESGGTFTFDEFAEDLRVGGLRRAHAAGEGRGHELGRGRRKEVGCASPTEPQGVGRALPATMRVVQAASQIPFTPTLSRKERGTLSRNVSNRFRSLGQPLADLRPEFPLGLASPSPGRCGRPGA